MRISSQCGARGAPEDGRVSTTISRRGRGVALWGFGEGGGGRTDVPGCWTRIYSTGSWIWDGFFGGKSRRVALATSEIRFVDGNLKTLATTVTTFEVVLTTASPQPFSPSRTTRRRRRQGWFLRQKTIRADDLCEAIVQYASDHLVATFESKCYGSMPSSSAAATSRPSLPLTTFSTMVQTFWRELPVDLTLAVLFCPDVADRIPKTREPDVLPEDVRGDAASLSYPIHQ